MKRAYLDFSGKFDGGINTRVTADLYRDANGSLNYRLKYAYFAWTPENSPLTLKFGQIHTPWLDWEEGLWDYRMQGTMPLERAGYSTSSDLGAGVDGAWGGQKLNMQLVVMNGEGYHGAEVDQHKDVAARGPPFGCCPPTTRAAAGACASPAWRTWAPPSGGAPAIASWACSPTSRACSRSRARPRA